MKSVEYHWDHPLLKKFEKHFKRDSHLFRQGDVGDTLIIIQKGIVRLTAERDGQELMISALEAGHVLGERCLIGTHAYKRFFGAEARTDVVVAEMKQADLIELERVAPALVLDIYKRVCAISVERQNRLDHMVKVLRPADNVERLVYLIVHYAHFEGRETPRGIELLLPIDTIRYFVAMSVFEIEECFKELNRMGILVSENTNSYLLVNQNALIHSIPKLREALPAINTIR